MKKVVLCACGLVCAMSLAVQADIIETWTGETDFFGAWFNGVEPPFCQTFTIPEGQVGTVFEFRVEKGFSTDPAKSINIVVYSGNTLMGIESTNYSDAVWGGGPQALIPVSGLNLTPGEYIAEMWASGGDANANTYLLRSTTSTYAGGEALTGWHPGTAIGANDDFMARVTTVAVPEPMTVLMLIGGGLGLIRSRSRR